jgi:hypothetical protein
MSAESAIAPGGPRQGGAAPSVWPFALGEVLFAAVAFTATLLLSPETSKAARAGLAAAAAGAACALPALRLGVPRGTNGVLAGFSLGFFARMISVALGLALSGARGPAALTWAFAFFALYAATQGVEIAYVFAAARKGSSVARRSTP